MIFTMPEMDQYQRKHLIHDQIWQLLKICLVPFTIKLSSPHKPYYNLRSSLFNVSAQGDHVTLSPISLNLDMK